MVLFYGVHHHPMSHWNQDQKVNQKNTPKSPYCFATVRCFKIVPQMVFFCDFCDKSNGRIVEAASNMTNKN